MIPISDGDKGLTHEMQSSPERLRADALSREIIGAAIEVHRHLGPGLSNLSMRSASAASWV